MSVTPEYDRPTVLSDTAVVGDVAVPAPRAAPASPPPVRAPAPREAPPSGSADPDGRRLHLHAVAADLETTATAVSWALRLALLGVIGLVLVLLLA